MSQSDQPLPISAAEMRDALAYCMKVVPKPDERPLLSFVAIVPEPEKHRFLVTARNGNAWVGAYVEGDGMHRIALTHASAALALARLSAEVRIQESPRLVPDSLARTTWYIASPTEGQDPVSIHLHEHFPRWDVRSKTRPPLFPEGWRAPRVLPSLSMTPTVYSSDVMQLGAFWKGTCARWWVDVVSEFARIEFARGDRLAAYAVVVPWGRKAGVTIPDARQTAIGGTEEPPTPPTSTPAASAVATDHKTRCAAILDDVMLRLRVPSMIRTELAKYRDLDSLDLSQLALLKHAEELAGIADAAPSQSPEPLPESVPETDPEPTIEDAPIPSSLSPALLSALQLADTFRRATARHEIAAWTNVNLEPAEAAERDAAAAFWSALERLSDDDRAQCTAIASDAEKLAATLAAHTEPVKRSRKKKGEAEQPTLPNTSPPAAGATGNAPAPIPQVMVVIDLQTWLDMSDETQARLRAEITSGAVPLEFVERDDRVEAGPVEEIAIPTFFSDVCAALGVNFELRAIDTPKPAAPLSDEEAARRHRDEESLANAAASDLTDDETTPPVDHAAARGFDEGPIDDDEELPPRGFLDPPAEESAAKPNAKPAKRSKPSKAKTSSKPTAKPSAKKRSKR